MRRRALLAASQTGGGALSFPIYIDDYDSCSGNSCYKDVNSYGVKVYEFLRSYIVENGENRYGTGYEIINDVPMVISKGIEFNTGNYTMYNETISLYVMEGPSAFYIYSDGYYSIRY